MKRKKPLIPFILLLLCLSLAMVIYPILKKNDTAQLLPKKTATQNTDVSKEIDEHSKEADIAPDFTITDIKGNNVHLSDFKGKPVVMNFWASWCGYCGDEMADFQKVYEAQKDDVVFLMININDGQRETEESALSFMEKKGITIPVYFSNMGDILEKYDAYSLPTTYIIDKDGNIYGYAKGRLDANTLETALLEVQS